MRRSVLIIPFALALVVIGLGISGAGSVIPEVAEHFSLPYAATGRVFLVHGLGYFVSLMVGGILGDFVFRGTVLRVGLWLAVLGFLGIAFSLTFSGVLLAFLIMGIGMGFLDCMVNPIAQSVFPERPGAVLSIIHAFFGLGSLLAPRFYAFLSTHGYSWQDLYKLTAGFTALTAGIFLLPFVPRNIGGDRRGALSRAFTGKVFWLLGGTMLLYAAGVSTLNGWLVTYYKERGIVPERGAIFLSYFWLGLLVGRFVLSSFSEKIGYLRLIKINALGGALGAALAVLSFGHSFFSPLFLFLSGFCLSTLIPLTLVYALLSFPEVASTASGWVLFNNGLGNFLFPWLFGIVGGRFGFSTTMGLVPLALFGVFLLEELLVRLGGSLKYKEKGEVVRGHRSA